MKELTKKELHQQLTDSFIKDQFTTYLRDHPNQRTAAALYAVGRLQSMLMSSMSELPNGTYKEVIRQLKG